MSIPFKFKRGQKVKLILNGAVYQVEHMRPNKHHLEYYCRRVGVLGIQDQWIRETDLKPINQ